MVVVADRSTCGHREWRKQHPPEYSWLCCDCGGLVSCGDAYVVGVVVVDLAGDTRPYCCLLLQLSAPAAAAAVAAAVLWRPAIAPTPATARESVAVPTPNRPVPETWRRAGVPARETDTSIGVASVRASASGCCCC